MKIFLLFILTLFLAGAVKSQTFMKEFGPYFAGDIIKYDDHSIVLNSAFKTGELIKINLDSAKIDWQLSMQVHASPGNCYAENNAVYITPSGNIIGYQNAGCYTMGGLFSYNAVFCEFDSTGAPKWQFETRSGVYEIIKVFANVDSTYTLFFQQGFNTGPQTFIMGKAGFNISTPQLYDNYYVSDFKDVIADLNGGFTGVGQFYDTITNQPALISIDDSLNKFLVKKIYGANLSLKRILQYPDSSYLLLGLMNNDSVTVLIQLDNQGNYLYSFKINEYISHQRLSLSESTVFLSYMQQNITGVLKLNSDLQLISNTCIVDTNMKLTFVDGQIIGKSYCAVFWDSIGIYGWLLKTDTSLTQLCYHQDMNLTFDTISFNLLDDSASTMLYGYTLGNLSPDIISNPWAIWKDSCEMITLSTEDFKLGTIENIKIYVYPNPVNNFVNVDVEEANGECMYRIISLTGSILIKGHISPGKNIINTQHLSKGIYFFEVRNVRGDRRCMKIIKV